MTDRVPHDDPTFPPLLLSCALTLLAGAWTSSGVVRRLDPNQVLAEAWRPDRLHRRRVLYGVSDGMHRTVAHREAGRKVKAEIGGYYSVQPARYALHRDQLWHCEGDGLLMAGLEAVPDDLRPVLLALGVGTV